MRIILLLMRASLIITLSWLIFPIHLFSQETLPSKNNAEYNSSFPDSSLIIIKGDEIRRFPSTNFLDAVNGLFPWVFSQVPDANNFLFVIDGYMLPDVNGISLYDIDEVIFTRNNLNGNLFPFSRAGIFYIKTKTANKIKPIINFNSQYNVTWNKKAHALPDYDLAPDYSVENHTMNKSGFFSSSQISLAVMAKKLQLNTSAQLDAIHTPHLYLERYTRSPTGVVSAAGANSGKTQTNMKFFLNLLYNFTDKLKAGITANYFNGHTTETMVTNSLPPANYNVSKRVSSILLNSYHMGSFINWEPFGNLKNKFSLEYSDNGYYYKTTYTTSSNTPSEKLYRKSYLLRDQLEYDILPKGKFRASVMAIFSTLHHKLKRESITITSINPMIHVAYNNLFSGYAGWAFIIDAKIYGYKSNPRNNPYAGLAFDLKNILKMETANRLDLSFQYADFAENSSNDYWLPGIAPQFYISPRLSAVYVPPYTRNVLLKNKLFSIQANTGLIENKALIGAEWSLLELQRAFHDFPYPSNYPYSLNIPGKETQSGLAFYISGKLIRKQFKQWDIRFNLLFPRIKYQFDGYLSVPPSPVNFTFQMGLQNKFQFGEFTVQANASYGLNRTFYIYHSFVPLEHKQFNEFILNYILLAYDLSNSNKLFLKKLSFFIQGRNLLSSKKAKEYYRFDSYGGIGFNLSLK